MKRDNNLTFWYKEETVDKKRFQDEWASQTELGKPYGISAVSVGKLLAEHGLRDSKTKEPTQRALDEGYARSTPLRSGIKHFMWSRSKTREVFTEIRRLPAAELHANRVWAVEREVLESEDPAMEKFGWYMVEDAQKEVPKNLREKVERLVEAHRAAYELKGGKTT